MAHGQETGSGKPALRQALPARGLELDLIFGLPSGPAAWNAPHQRPHTCQHPTTGHTALEDFSCSERGVHTCQHPTTGHTALEDFSCSERGVHTCQHPTTGQTALEDFSCSERGVHTCQHPTTGQTAL